MQVFQSKDWESGDVNPPNRDGGARTGSDLDCKCTKEHKRELNVVAKRTDSWLVLGWLGKVARQLKTIEDVDNKKPMPYLKQSLKK